MTHKRYLLWLLILCCITLLPAIALNWVLLSNEGDVKGMSFAASDWQQKTHGITYTPTMGHNFLFKTLRLNDRLHDIDTIVLGSSTGMPIDTDMVPKGWKLYNYTQSGSPLAASISQAEYLVRHAPWIKHYIIAIDWALDFPYQSSRIAPADLSRPMQNASLQHKPSVLATLHEAISYPRMDKLKKILVNIAKSPHPAKTFREYFLQLGSDEYTCPDGKSVGKDFGIYNRGSCNGFRYDGSATYNGYSHINNYNTLIISALASDSQYVHALQHTHGEIDAGQFAALTKLNQAIVKNGGVLMLYMPPLMPGLERAFLAHPPLSDDLKRTKLELAEWAGDKPVILADFGQSEKFGCTPDEFLDEHHADPTCYRKIFPAFWQTETARKALARIAAIESKAHR